MCIFHFSLIILSFKSKLTFRIFASVNTDEVCLEELELLF